jgi:CRP-like cAMP-binding protein
MATVLSDGALVEAATVGDGGIVGIDAFFADDAFAVCEAIVQVPVRGQTAEIMRVADFRQELARRGAFYDAIARYAQLLHAQLIRLTACNARHPVHARCARWLLTAHDHLHGEEFRLSHEFLAVMLGVRRQTVSLVAASFQAAGLIRYTHGRITVLDRGRLEHMACECYPALRALAARFDE